MGERVEEFLAGGAYSLPFALGEVASAIWKYAVLRRVLGVEMAERLLGVFTELAWDGVVILEGQSVYLVEVFNHSRGSSYNRLRCALCCAGEVSRWPGGWREPLE